MSRSLLAGLALVVAGGCADSSSAPGSQSSGNAPIAAPAASPQTAPGEAVAPANTSAESDSAATSSAAPSSELTPTPALDEPSPAGPEQLQLVEATLSQLEQALATRLVTPAQLTEAYLARIAAYDDGGPKLNSILALDPSAAEQARALGARCEDAATRGPLCGIPVLLKDNIDAAGLPTTAGSLALARSVPAGDAFLTRKLRQAGAIVLGKATLSEFANFLGSNMPSGYSSLGGYGLNPYDPRPQPGGDGRPVLTPGGSSSGPGIAVSANLVAVAVGTETSGSILSPASSNGVVGIKPTLGLVSRAGILPISADQDTAGPLARTVEDAARLLGVLAGYDPQDSATEPCNTPGNCFDDYTQFLDAGALAGARIAVPPFPGQRDDLMQAAIEVLQAQGAQVQTIRQLPVQSGTCVSVPANAACSTVLIYGFHRDLDRYLAAIPNAPVPSLAALIEANDNTPGALKYGQRLALAAQALDVSAGSADTQRYQADRQRDLQGSRAALDAVYAGTDGTPGTDDDVDALLFSENYGAATPAMAGYPSVAVPGGFVPATAPVANPAPSDVTFSGPRFSEPRLIAIAYAYEQATHLRRPPASTPALPGDTFRR
ncbi:MAG TPA: amidase family protein [Polyangiaceae bacterium]|nr:amidase family protein [Polyangiaceae bacterium]